MHFIPFKLITEFNNFCFTFPEFAFLRATNLLSNSFLEVIFFISPFTTIAIRSLIAISSVNSDEMNIIDFPSCDKELTKSKKTFFTS